jgi:thiol-disulfide isomerase/thioredoxin
MSFLKLFTNIKVEQLFNFLIFIALSACSGQKYYTEKKFKDAIIIEGSISKDNLFKHPRMPWAAKNYQAYKLDSLNLQKISTATDSISFLIFAGTWCSDTQRELPAFLKVLDALKFGSNHYQIWMLDIKKQSSFINTKLLDIQYVPTFIVLKNGKEIGRIIEKPKQSLELDLLEITQNHLKN